ncbi:MAG: FtsW/RodA/SpoVE family cell cycle protein [Fusobacteriaceae bacterium]
MESKNIYTERNQFQIEKEEALRAVRMARRTRNILIIVGVIMTLSVMNIYSATYYNMGMKIAYLQKHIFYLLLGVIIFVLTASLNYKKLSEKKINGLIFLISISILAIMPVLAKIAPSIVPRVNGAITWIRIPYVFRFQPVETFKIFFIIVIANRLAFSESNGETGMKLILSNIIEPLVFSLFLILQNDVGTLIHYFAIFCVMFFMSKINGKYIWAVGITFLSVFLGGLFYIYRTDFGQNASYKILRVKSFLTGLFQNYYDSDKGYQVKQSLIGIGSGKLFGVGYGNGIQKYNYLPEINTDFIFASFAEEWGFFGIVILLLLFLGLFNQIKSSASDCEDFFGKYLVIGIAGLIFSQFLINLSVAMGLLPVFGIPMPIMSYGGNSIMTIFAGLGIVFNINRKRIK